MAETTLNIPSLLLVLGATFLLLRYLFFSSSSPNSTSRTANPAHIEQIAQMFPQISRRDIQWDLQRNGGSVQATTERVLRDGRLEVPPPSFQPLPPPTTSPSTASSQSKQPPPPDLITRYNLASKLSSSSNSSPRSTSDPIQNGKTKPVWSQNKAERQALLQRRREEMILSARRKMEEKERERGGS